MPEIYTIDFETDRIENRPKYPPEPVGVAVRDPGGDRRYWAWGHPTENNCSKEQAVRRLRDIWYNPDAEMLFHHAKFDLAVAWERLGLPIPHWRRIHDTMFLLFLADPHSRSLGLKPSAEELLNWPPEEQDAVREWILAHKKQLMAVYGGKITTAQSGPNSPGAWISKAPGDLVGEYAIGDVDRTWGLFEHLAPIIKRENMWKAYNRERRIVPMLMENEAYGLRCDTETLGEDLPKLRKDLDRSEDWIRKTLKKPGLNIDADQQLAEALSAAGLVDEDKWVLTPSGQKSVSKDNLTPDMFNDPEFAAMLGYRNRMQTVVNTFLTPWLEQAEATGGWIHTNWNQVRDPQGGTRTGRPSTSNHNFLNIAKSLEGRSDGYIHPTAIQLRKLPLARYYVLPDPGEVFCHRDFDGQELRVFGHFECGELQAAYLKDPDLDPHGWVKDMIRDLAGHDYERGKVKIVNFQGIYGGGAPAAAKAMNTTINEARAFKKQHDRALPGRQILNDVIESIVRRGDPIVTWGGRKYFPEDPKWIDGKKQSFEYKLINYLIQGSAADITKEVMGEWYEHPDREARFLVQVYDEINLSAPEEIKVQQMQLLKDLMEETRLDVPMRSSGKWGYRWGELEECD